MIKQNEAIKTHSMKVKSVVVGSMAKCRYRLDALERSNRRTGALMASYRSKPSIRQERQFQSSPAASLASIFWIHASRRCVIEGYTNWPIRAARWVAEAPSRWMKLSRLDVSGQRLNASAGTGPMLLRPGELPYNPRKIQQETSNRVVLRV